MIDISSGFIKSLTRKSLKQKDLLAAFLQDNAKLGQNSRGVYTVSGKVPGHKTKVVMIFCEYGSYKLQSLINDVIASIQSNEGSLELEKGEWDLRQDLGDKFSGKIYTLRNKTIGSLSFAILASDGYKIKLKGNEPQDLFIRVLESQSARLKEVS